MGMKIMDTMRMTTVSPRPGRKKSMNFRLPGRTIRVLSLIHIFRPIQDVIAESYA